jgi:hypothetical protein
MTCARLVVGFGIESDIAAGGRTTRGLQGLFDISRIVAVFVVAFAACKFDETAFCFLLLELGI